MKRISFFPVMILILFVWLLPVSGSACSSSFGLQIKHWHHKLYHLKLTTVATSEAEPGNIHTHTKTLKTWVDRVYGILSDGGLCMKGMIGDLKPDKNGIIHVKISIVVDRKGFDASKPEVVYVDVKDRKKLKVTDLSAHNWRSSYHKYQSWILYYLADDDRKK